MSMTVQVDNDTSVSVALHGATWAFRAAFDDHGVQSYRNESDGTYYRVIPNTDVAKNADSITSVLGIDGVLKNLVVRVLVEGKPTKGSEADSFIKSLQDLPNLFF